MEVSWSHRDGRGVLYLDLHYSGCLLSIWANILHNSPLYIPALFSPCVQFFFPIFLQPPTASNKTFSPPTLYPLSYCICPKVVVLKPFTTIPIFFSISPPLNTPTHFCLPFFLQKLFQMDALWHNCHFSCKALPNEK